MTDRLTLRFAGVEWRVYERSGGDRALVEDGDATQAAVLRGEPCLAFDSAHELRLYCPPPPYWPRLSETQVAEYWASARVIEKRDRRQSEPLPD